MAFALTNTIPASPFRQYNNTRKVSPGALNIRTGRVNCSSSDSQHGEEINRRNVLIGFGSLCSVAASAKAANAGYKESGNSSLQPVNEFGSEPRSLDKVIRAHVDVPKKKKDVVILAIDGIEISNKEPVRFDAYISKPVGNMVGADYGEYVGSEVNLAHQRHGVKGKLELGITYLLKDMGAEDSDKIVVTLVPRTGEVIIGGIHIYTEQKS